MAVNVGQRNVPDTAAFHSWCENAGKGNSYKLLQRMKSYYRSLWEEPYEDQKTQ